MAKKKIEKVKEEVKHIEAKVSKKLYYQGAAAGGIVVAVIAIIIALIF